MTECDETAGLMMVVVDAESDQDLEAAILASAGGEPVQILEFAMLAGAPYTLLKGAVYIHATLAEGFWTLMEEVKPVDLCRNNEAVVLGGGNTGPGSRIDPWPRGAARHSFPGPA
jgi:hypothetical protein